MHKSEFQRSSLLNLLGITNPKPSEQHLTTLSAKRNPTCWTCSESQTLNLPSNTSQYCLQERIGEREPQCSRTKQPAMRMWSHRKAHRKMRLRRQEERLERKECTGIQSSRAGQRSEREPHFEQTPPPPIHGQARFFPNCSDRINLMS
jgi:hypothetical protein